MDGRRPAPASLSAWFLPPRRRSRLVDLEAMVGLAPEAGPGSTPTAARDTELAARLSLLFR